VPIRTEKRAVPRYMFHHVEISKNILSPNTPLKYIPHLKDLQEETGDTEKFNKWIESLEDMDQKSGFDTTKRNDKAAKTRAAESARMLSLYLERWLERMGLPLDKAALVRFVERDAKNDDAVTPPSKSGQAGSGDDARSRHVETIARNFATAWNRVFQKTMASLEDVLALDESVDNPVDKKLSKDSSLPKSPEEELLEQVHQYLMTYTALGCLICHSHSCEHGEINSENVRCAFGIDDAAGRLKRLVNTRRVKQARELENGTAPKTVACKNQCFGSYDVGPELYVTKRWTDSEQNLLRTMFVVLAEGPTKPQCTVATLLGRYCWDVYRQMKKMDLRLPKIQPPPDAAPPAKPVSWYNRFHKILTGDWQDHTFTHEHALRESRDPCSHDGPCTAAKGCPCVEAKVLCERFCRCTAETCAYKFTGCGCHAGGKTCYARQKEGKPCVCVQLNRECDPVLCGRCGALERADPENVDNDHLHSTGCQNVVLQRGRSKTVLLGESQLKGCGYGLFTAEDIGADEFVIEYMGELITHDEGVRREARRGNVFNQESNASYLFTLLENDGIWVDAAIYGNLSRYINHAGEHDKRGCNITPKILYVNGDFRIKFTATRDIKAGEELFFNYGENFPNLTKKLLEDKAELTDGEAAAMPVGSGKKKKRGGRRQPRDSDTPNDARKTMKQDGARKEAPPVSRQESFGDEYDPDEFAAKLDEDIRAEQAQKQQKVRGGARKRKRIGEADEDDEAADEWRPGGRDIDDDYQGSRGGRLRRVKRRATSASAPSPVRPADAATAAPLDSDHASYKTPTRKPRGGRRKKSPRAAPPAADNVDSDEPLMRTASARRRRRLEQEGRATGGGGGGGGGKDVTVPPAQFYGGQPRAKVDSATTSSFGLNGSKPVPGSKSTASGPDGPDVIVLISDGDEDEGDEDDEDDDDEDPVDSSSRARRRQKPARYRSDD